MIFLCLVLTIFSAPAFAFPELVRHGYANCTACHLSPSGGGVLTEYGRSLSKEVLSTWGYEGEENLLHGAVKTPEWLLPGGDIRYIQTYLNNPQVYQGNFFNMQADVDVAVSTKHWAVDATAGVIGGPVTTRKRGQFISRRHYVMYRPAEEYSVRVGRFLPAFGINQPNHISYTERDIGFDQGTESYNLELSYLGEHYDTLLTVIGGRPDDLTIDAEKGFSGIASAFMAESYKVGLSVYAGETNQATRRLGGLFGVLGFSKKIFLMSEVDYQVRNPKAVGSNQTKGMVSFQRLNYEWYQGIHTYLVSQLSYLDFDHVTSRIDSHGLGLQFFPRPHFEFNVEYLKERNIGAFDTYYDTGWALLHYYL